MKRRRRVESSSPQSGSDFSTFLDGLEEDLGAAAPTDTDPVTTQMFPTVSPSAAVASTVPASSGVLLKVHIHPIEVPTTLPSGSDVGESYLRTEIDPMEDDDPHHGRVMEAPRPPLRLMCQVSDILADHHMSGGNDTEFH